MAAALPSTSARAGRTAPSTTRTPARARRRTGANRADSRAPAGLAGSPRAPPTTHPHRPACAGRTNPLPVACHLRSNGVHLARYGRRSCFLRLDVAPVHLDLRRAPDHRGFAAMSPRVVPELAAHPAPLRARCKIGLPRDPIAPGAPIAAALRAMPRTTATRLERAMAPRAVSFEVQPRPRAHRGHPSTMAAEDACKLRVGPRPRRQALPDARGKAHGTSLHCRPSSIGSDTFFPPSIFCFRKNGTPAATA